MVFGFGKKRKPPAAPADPIAAFDGLIEDLERQAAQVRRSAATLLALKGDLTRDLERYRRVIAEVERRLATADARHDAKAVSVLTRDRSEGEGRLRASEQALAAAEGDSKLLLGAAEGLAGRIAELRAERSSARARLSVGLAVTAALRERVEQFDRVLALDEARDEVERAHALADIYREDAGAGAKGSRIKGRG
ncbi:MAG: hypothetical protein HYZ28_15780 [Myxococcales bacterium]|nr:hypothetical protein [Myxococcales bacterium]